MQSAYAKTISAQQQIRRTGYDERPVRISQPQKRIVKMDGNVAYVSNGFAKKKIQQPGISAKKETKQKPKTKTGLVSTIIVLFIAFCALALLVSRYAMVCSINSKNNELENRLDTIEAEINNMAIDLELKDNLEYVHSSAQTELGMKYPQQNQKITISLDG